LVPGAKRLSRESPARQAGRPVRRHPREHSQHTQDPLYDRARMHTHRRVPLASVAVVFLLAACRGEAPSYPEHTDAAPAAAREVVRPGDTPEGIAYAPAVFAADTLYLAGQDGRDWQTGTLPDGIDAQTRAAMVNIRRVLEAAGLTQAHLVECHVYLASMDDYAGMNAAYGSAFEGRVPARTTVEVVALPGGAGVQIACIGHRDLSAVTVVTVPDGALPQPLGPYSPAVWAGDTLYLSGMGGQFPADRRLPGSLAEQSTQTLANIRTTLDAAGLTFADVVSSHAYVTAGDELPDLGPAFAKAFGEVPLPPHGVSLLPRLPGGIKVEITFVAARESRTRTSLEGPDVAGSTPRGLLAGSTFYTRTESAPDSGDRLDAQVRGVFGRVAGTLRAGGFDLDDIAHLQVEIADIGEVDRIEALVGEAFGGGPQPPRTVVQVMLPPGTVVQMRAVAAR
jgi:2-iminobutanoate/2-iminopropanoate deaminase